MMEEENDAENVFGMVLLKPFFVFLSSIILNSGSFQETFKDVVNTSFLFFFFSEYRATSNWIEQENQ